MKLTSFIISDLIKCSISELKKVKFQVNQEKEIGRAEKSKCQWRGSWFADLILMIMDKYLKYYNQEFNQEMRERRGIKGLVGSIC